MKIIELLLLGSTLFGLSLTAATNLIERVEIDKNRLDVIVNKEFKNAYLLEDFFVEYDADIDLEKLDYSVVIMPFIMNVASLVWISGKEYYIESMDKDVFDSLERIKAIFKVFYPKTTWNGTIIPKKLVLNKPVPSSPTKAALLFSGGLDSTSTSLAHLDKEQLLITAWGQSALPLDDAPFWYKIKRHLGAFAETYKHKTAYIKSNYYYFLNLKKLQNLSPEIVTWRINTIEDIGWAGLTAPILITQGISSLYIAASDTWGFAYPSACNPYIDANITFAGIQIMHDQFEWSRYDKVAFIADLVKQKKAEKPQFIICQKRGGIINCTACEKCLLTILSLLAEGEQPYDYGFNTTVGLTKKNMQKLFKLGTLSACGLWQFKDLQKKVQQNRNSNQLDKQHNSNSNQHAKHHNIKHGKKNQSCDLEWLLSFDFSKKKAYDVRHTQCVDWSILEKMFPDIKNQ